MMNLDERLLQIGALLKQVTFLTWNSLPEERRNSYVRLRELHPNAGKPWTAKDDEELRRLYAAGNAIDELAPLFARTANGVRQRLVRLGLTDDVRPPKAA